MTSPEEALERAREAAERKRAEGVYPPRSEPAPSDRDYLAEWAVLRGDPDVVYSTRRLGAPLTALKRLLLRAMRQYLLDVEARQTRFNAAMLDRLDQLERRVSELERRG